MSNRSIVTQEDFDYVDWISNISGKLLFRLTNPFNYRNDRIVGDIIHFNKFFHRTKKRIVIVSMLIDIRDKKIDTDHREYTRVIFIADTHEEKVQDDRVREKLYGDIFLINPKIDDYEFFVDEKNLIQTLSSTIEQNKINKNISKDTEEESIKKLSLELKDTTIEFLKKYEEKKHHIYHARICIKDTGFIFFKVIQCPSQGKKIKSQQAFYFIKYLFHKHAFHPITQENITKLPSYQSA